MRLIPAKIISNFFSVKKTIFFLGFLFIHLLAAAQETQDGQLYIFGVVKDVENSKKMDGVTVTVKKNGQEVDKIVTNASGKYEFFLDIAGDYLIEYSKSGVVSKKVALDSKNVPIDDASAGFSMNIDMTLFKTMEGLDVSILNQPIGRAKYNAETGQLEFDFEYTKTIKDQLNKMMAEFDSRQKELNKEQEQADKDADAKLAAFEKLVADGDKNASAKVYDKAIVSYEEAIKIKPDAADVKTKLKDVQAKFNELNASKEKEGKYKKAIEEADSFFRTEDFDKALTKYQEAVSIKTEEKYPKDQIAKTNKIIEERKKSEATDKAFNDLVLKGDNYVKASDYELAISNYQDASKLKPTDADVKLKIEDAKTKIAEAKKGEENKKKYDEIIANADKLFKDVNYKDAIAQYNAALVLKPKESYPQGKIDECNKKIEELSKKEEDEKKNIEQNKLFDDLVAQGDAAVSKNNFSDAITKFSDALKIKPEDAPVKKKLEDADKKSKELANAKEIGEKYDASIKDADKLFSTQKYAESIERYKEALALKSEEKYPKDRIEEINKLVEENAKKEADKKAEEERLKGEEQKAAEALEKFNTLVKQGDGAIENKKFTDAVSYYSEALVIKADDKKTNDKLDNARKLLDSSMAEAEKDKAYQDLIAQADEKFKEKVWDESIKIYKQALEIKQGEIYPKQKIDEIEKTIRLELEDTKAKEEQDKAKAGQEARLKEEQEKFDLLLADADNFMQKEFYDQAIDKYSEALLLRNNDSFVLGKIDEAKQKKRDLDNLKDVNARYETIIGEADKQLSAQKYEDARSLYNNAIDLKPTEEYPKTKIEEIDNLLAELKASDENSLLQEKLKAEEEARLAEKKRLDEEERLRLEAENSNKSMDEEYNTYIEVADKDFEKENYEKALSNYTAALALKAEEFYPKSKIEKINQILAEAERLKLEQGKLAALEEEKKLANKKIKGTRQSVDSESERQAEEFMRQAREREQNEKYERIKKIMHDQQDNNEDYEEKANTAISSNLNAITTFKDNQNSFANNSTSSFDKRNENMTNYKETMFQQQNAMVLANNEKLIVENEKIKQQSEAMAEMTQEKDKARIKNIESVDSELNKYQTYFRDLGAKNTNNSIEAKEKIEKIRIENQVKGENSERLRLLEVNEIEKNKDKTEAYYKQKNNTQKDIINQNQKLIDSQLKYNNKLSEKQNDQSSSNYKQLQEQQNELKKAGENYNESADKARQENQKDIEIYKVFSTKEKENLFRSKLAEDYPQGVTEESSTQGYKVIIRRIVVDGNIADDYKKVLDKSGSYYFKNGQSISETTWARETTISKE
jgi:tetratricopeptide (TPR) repeat protein